MTEEEYKSIIERLLKHLDQSINDGLDWVDSEGNPMPPIPWAWQVCFHKDQRLYHDLIDTGLI